MTVLDPHGTRAQVLGRLRRALAGAGIETAALDARLLLRHALGIDAAALIARPDEPVEAGQGEALAALAARRLAHEPMARILGEREFWGLTFLLSPDTLVPRPDTETVVAAALDLIPASGGPFRIADFGTGTGCILVALLSRGRTRRDWGSTAPSEALRTARCNARLNGVGERAWFLAANWADSLRGTFDLIVSNPPYIATCVVDTLDRDVREHDPHLALDGGPDGLDAYRALVGDAARLLTPAGRMVLEIGYDQAEAVSNLATASGLEILVLRHDLGGNPRCIALKRT